MSELVRVADAQVLVRRPRAADQGYVASTWVDSMTRRSKWDERPSGAAAANALVDRLLEDPTVRVLIAAEPTRDNIILGWLCYASLPRTTVIHYAYVRDKMRRHGIGRALLQQAMGPHTNHKIVYTMRGPDTDALARKHPGAIHMPIEEFLAP